MTEPAGAQPPTTGSAWSPSGPSGPRAGFFRRLGAVIVDALVVGIPVGIILALVNSSALYALWTVVGLAYFTYFEGSQSGQTVGKRALGIRVIDYQTGGPIGYGRAFIRWIGRIISALLCYLGYLWMLWDREKQTWHDKLANDVVVPTDAYPVHQWP